VISTAGRPDGQPDLKKPTALRGVVGVWDRESGDRIKGCAVGKDLIECVRIYMERAAQVEHLALEHAEDAIDEQIARVRLDDIKTDRTKLVGGDALAKRLADLE